MTDKNKSIQEWFDTMENACIPFQDLSEFQWSAKGTGFGSFYFFKKEGSEKLYCENECMGKEFIKKMLCQMVDDCVLMDEKDAEGNWKPRP